MEEKVEESLAPQNNWQIESVAYGISYERH